MASRLSERDDVDKGSECVFDLFCQPCSEDNTHLEAEGYCMDCKEYLCKDCYANHRKPRPTRHHVLLQTDKLPQHIPISKPQTAIDPCTIPCDKHPNETIKYYCEKHDVVVCSVCVTLTHASCRMNYIPDIADGAKHGGALKTATATLNELAETLSTINERTHNNLENVQDIYNGALKAVEKLRIDINEMIDELELRVKAEADVFKEADMENIQSIAQKSSNIQLELNVFREQLDELQQCNQENNLFVTAHVTQDKLRELKQRTEALNELNQVTNYTFERSEEVWDFVNTTNAYGQLYKYGQLIQQQLESRGSNMLITKHIKDVPLIDDEDENICMITGTTLLPGQLLVLVDYTNKSLYVFDIDDCNITCKFILPDTPWDVTRIGRRTVAITLDKGSLLCLLIGKHVLVENEIAVSGCCVGVAFSKARYFVTFVNPTKLEILTQDGHILQTITSHANGDDMFGCPNYVITNNDDILVSDSCTNKVTIFNRDGHLNAEYKSEILDESLDMVATGRGSVFVCGCKTNNIHVLSDKGCFRQILLSSEDGIQKPQSLAFSEKLGWLFVTQEYDKKLQIFHV